MHRFSEEMKALILGKKITALILRRNECIDLIGTGGGGAGGREE